jgi:PAS domain S-box-containing protein
MEKGNTKHRQSEGALFESETRFRLIFENVKDIILFVDKYGRILSVNKKVYDILGYKQEEILGRNFTKLGIIRLKDFPKIVKFFRDAIRADEKLIPLLELDLKHKNGTWVNLEVGTTVLKKDGETIGTLNIFRDITKRKQTEEIIKRQNIQLRKLDELKTAFLNVTSHELRAPMASIKGYIQLILKQKLGEITGEQKKALEVVLRNINRLDHLIQDILDVSRLESGTMKFVSEKTDVRKMVEETVETVQSSADLKDIKINTELEDKLPILVVDSERIKQVIMNILNNAIKFSPDGSVVNVRAKKEKDFVLFEFQDFGRGIPKNKQEKIFHMFYQVNSGVDLKFGGVGLGLSISRGIVLAHNGKIWVESKVGKGSTFRFTLPVKQVKDVMKKFKAINIFGIENK